MDFARRSGTLLLVAAWSGAFGVAWLAFDGWVRDQDNPNRALPTNGPEEIALARNRAGHYVADGAINGVPVTFLVDTGATAVAMSLALARELRLDLGPATTVQTANGAAVAYRTRLDAVRLGPIELNDVTAIAAEGMDGRGVLLGMTFLGKLELAQRDGQLVIRRPGGG